MPGALPDFDPPELTELAGTGRVVLANPFTAAGVPASFAAAKTTFGKSVRLLVDPSTVISRLVE